MSCCVRPRIRVRALIHQPVDPRGLRKPRNRKLAEVAPVALADAGKAFRRHDGAMQFAGELFQPRRQIYRRPNAGEIEPGAAADIAVKNSSDMQCDAEPKTLDGLAEGILQRLDAGAGFARGL